MLTKQEESLQLFPIVNERSVYYGSNAPRKRSGTSNLYSRVPCIAQFCTHRTDAPAVLGY
jgi:hypothetical protein